VRPVLSLAVALLSASCAGRQVRVSPAATRALASPEDACRRAEPEVPDLATAGGLPGHAGPLPGAPVEVSRVERPRPVFQVQPLLSLEPPGQPRSEVQGCLAAGPTAAAGARYPAPPELPEDSVRVNPLAGGLLITHELVHPCCLQAAISTAVEGATVRVTEVLRGTPCGCQCASRLRAAVPLPPGRYSVELVVREPSGAERTVSAGATILPGE